MKLRELASDSGGHMAYGDALYKSRNRNNVVRHHYALLKQFGHLRNALVHQRFDKDHYIADPHEGIVDEIERVEQLLMKPPLALSIASQPVICFSSNTLLKDILKELERTGYTQFPIYDNSKFIGLLSEGGIAKWMSKNINGSIVSLDHILAKDILLCEKKRNVRFLNRQSTIYDIENVFEEAFDRNEKLESILITQTGIDTQKPIGIVTSWDLVQIDHSTLSLISQV